MTLRKRWIIGLLMAYTASVMAQPKVIAHRGYTNPTTAPPGSITALLKADSIGCDGATLDVWLTADDRLMVHPESIYQNKKIERCTALTLSALKLSNGERLPTLEACMIAVRELRIDLIVELRSTLSPKRDAKARRMIEALAAKYAMEGRIELRIPSAIQQQLPTSIARQSNYCSLSHLKRHPRYASDCKQVGRKLYVGKADGKLHLKWLLAQPIEGIITRKPLLLLRLLNE